VASTVTPQTASAAQSKTPPQAEGEQFEDPAILSYGKRPNAIPTEPRAQANMQERFSTPPLVLHPAERNNASNMIVNKSTGMKKVPERAVTLQGPFSNLDINSAIDHEQLDDTDEPHVRADNVRRVSLTKTRTGKPMDDEGVANGEGAKKKGKKKRKDAAGHAGIGNEADAEPSPDARRGLSAQFRGKGWRQTPMLQDPAAPESPRRGANKGSARKSRKQQAMDREVANNGWATEDATDIQDLGEFDFASNLSKFDKRSVFEQIRTEDTTADEDRLVHFNRTARPGTYGGKNYHPTENVLDSPKIVPRLSNQKTDSDEGFDIASSRASRRIDSRASSRRPPHRVGSGVADDTSSLKDLARSARSLRPVYTGSSSHGATGSPNPQHYTPPESPASSQTLGAHFRVVTTNRACPTIMPAGMAAIEEVAETEFGLTTEIMTENAGRGIAEVAMATINASTAKRNTRDGASKDTRPWALIIAGNHKSGARALAACRHLRSRNIRTLTCLLGFDRQTIELEREVKKQADILVKMNGYVRGWADTKSYLSREGQPDLVIDALMAASKPFDILSLEDQKAVIDIVGWTRKLNPTRGVTLSVDMPCGINGSTGEPSVIDPTTAQSLQIQTNHIICIGAPRIGLLRALQKIAIQKSASIGGPASQYSVELLTAQIWVVDIGVEKAWKNSGLAASKGIKFGSEWVVPVKLVDGLGGEDGR
jgi:enhancer of mRNA-decapping protein 3